MATVVALAEVQQWLERTKLTLDNVDSRLAESARLKAFSDIASAYNTSTWISAATTPALVRSGISMLIAAWEYQRAYAEEGDTFYGDKLETKACALFQSISDGSTELEELPGVGSISQAPDFYPNDLTGASEIFDAQGNLIGVAGSEDIKFTMCSRW